MLAVSPAIADKPAWAADGKGKKAEKADRGENAGNQSGSNSGGGNDRSARDDSRGSGVKAGEYFGDAHRSAVHDYYSKEFSRGFCPPGLAKKQNGCMPPGQAKKWTVGRALPRDVVFYDLPRTLLEKLDRPPAGNRYVRVDSDILMIAKGTGIVLDAIQNLGSR